MEKEEENVASVDLIRVNKDLPIIPKRRNRKTLMKKFAEVFAGNLCNVTAACEQMSIDRSTFLEWMRECPSFQETIENIRAQIIDQCEANLLHQIYKEKNVAISKYWLEHQSKEWLAQDTNHNDFKVQIVKNEVNSKEDIIR